MLDISITILGESEVKKGTCPRSLGLDCENCASKRYLLTTWFANVTGVDVFLDLTFQTFFFFFYPSLRVRQPGRQVFVWVEDHPGLARVIPTLGTVIPVSNWMVLNRHCKIVND